MAASLSTTLLPNSLLYKRITKQSSILNPFSLSSNKTLNLSHALEYPNNLLKLSPSKHHVTLASAVSSSTGVQPSEETWGSLESVKVFDLEGNGIPLSDLWKDRRAVVAFARHFGYHYASGACFAAKGLIILPPRRLRLRLCLNIRYNGVMDASGVALVLIGPGSIDQAKSFAEQTNFQGEIYADPAHSSYEAFKFVSGVLSTFTPNAGLKIIQLYMEGYRQDWKLSFEKDTVSRGGWKQGGIIVAGPGKSNISYIHKDKEAGDDPDIEDILKACCS